MVFNSIMSFTEVRPIDPIIYSWGLGALCGWGLGVLITMFFALRKWRHDDEIEAGFMVPSRDPILIEGARESIAMKKHTRRWKYGLFASLFWPVVLVYKVARLAILTVLSPFILIADDGKKPITSVNRETFLCSGCLDQILPGKDHRCPNTSRAYITCECGARVKITDRHIH